jgi:hypothetical protein
VQPNVVKLAPRCQLGSTNNLTKNSGIGCARGVSADFIKNASANWFALAPLNPAAQNDWHYCVIGAFTGFIKRRQVKANAAKWIA